jgi:hypothetical protein
MNHNASDIGRGSERWIANYIEIREARQAKRIAYAPSAGAFHIKQQFGVLQTHSRIQSEDSGDGTFCLGTQTIGSRIECRKSWVCLKNYVRLTGNPERTFIGMAEDCGGRIIGSRSIGRALNYCEARTYKKK